MLNGVGWNRVFRTKSKLGAEREREREIERAWIKFDLAQCQAAPAAWPWNSKWLGLGGQEEGKDQ
jgi:hypothetical protein